MSNACAYVIFIAPDCRGAARPAWSWRHVAADGDISANGECYPSLHQCFAAVRDHDGDAGPTPIKVNLLGAN